MKTFQDVHFKGTFRSYQQSVLENASQFLEDGKIHIVAAPGSGKTILGLEMIRRIGKPCIIFSPTTTIQHQWGERFNTMFLTDSATVDTYVSYDLKTITLLNSITYQALYAAMNKKVLNDDEENIDYSSIDLFQIICKEGIGTICLDEAHHLQNEWQKALEQFIKRLPSTVKVISLTATPPYDARTTEWNRYMELCGEIDDEIFVPELVKDKTLCPHQDYIYFNYPTLSETITFKSYRKKTLEAVEFFAASPLLVRVAQQMNKTYFNQYDFLYNHAEAIISFFVFCDYAKIPIAKSLRYCLTRKSYVPKFSLLHAENALRFIYQFFATEEEKKAMENYFKEHGLMEKKQICLQMNEVLKKRLLSSSGKLASIQRIVEAESAALKQKLHMLILTDYIKKESLEQWNKGKTLDAISVVSVFDAVIRCTDEPVAVLSGSLIILPLKLQNEINAYFGSDNKYRLKPLIDPRYGVFDTTLPNKTKVQCISYLFENEKIRILIGTKALLGEGWDSPCINSLVLASFIGSYVSSNQMRGRAIRIYPKDPKKVANIWHLVTIEPPYLFEDKVINQVSTYLHQMYDTMPSLDYELMEQRFDCFVGPNYRTGEIESGIARLEIIQSPYTPDRFESINQSMLALASNRNAVRSQWENETIGSAKLSYIMEIPKEQRFPIFSFNNFAMVLFFVLIETALIFMIGYSFFATASIFYQNIGMILFLCLLFLMMGYIFRRALWQLQKHYSPARSFETMGKVILKTLKNLDIVKTNCSVKVINPSKTDVSISLCLANATVHEQSIFNLAMKELLSPIENPRYIIIKTSRLKRLNFKQSFACPTILGQKKEYIGILEKELRREMQKMELCCTRNEYGRELILKCRKSSYITYCNKKIHRKQKVTHWK